MLVSSRFKAIIIATVARHSAGALTIERAIDFLDHTPGSEPIFHPSRLLNLRRKDPVPTGTASPRRFANVRACFGMPRLSKTNTFHWPGFSLAR